MQRSGCRFSLLYSTVCECFHFHCQLLDVVILNMCSSIVFIDVPVHTPSKRVENVLIQTLVILCQTCSHSSIWNDKQNVSEDVDATYRTATYH